MTAAMAGEEAGESRWRPMVLAMGKSAGATISGGLVSALGTKIFASLLGPGAMALLATLQQLRDGAVTVATANGRTALVQGACALRGAERREYLRTVALLFSGGTLLVTAAMMAAPGRFARFSGLPGSSAALLPWLALTVAFLSVFLFFTAMLNALREIGTLAWLQVASPLSAAAVAWPMSMAVRQGHASALVWYLAIPAGVTALGAAIALRGHREQFREWFRGSGRWWSFGAARGFFSISGVLLASGLIGTCVLLALRGSITRQQGLAMTGQFDAAWSISMNQVTLILGSVQSYYLPTLAAEESAAERGKQIRSMLMATTLAMVPVIVTLVALKPLAVHLFYSPQFLSSPGFLRWTLLGDYLKVSSWVLATPMLATGDARVFLASDLLMQGLFFGSAMILSRYVQAAEGAAIGFLISYAAYLAVSYGYARARHMFRLGSAGWTSWLTGLFLIFGASANAWSDTSVHFGRALFWIILAGGFSIGFTVYLRQREV
jgi:PST family polysaccharide transporter